MDYLSILLADRSRTSCDHCDRKDEWGRDIRFRSLRRGVSCPGCAKCDGRQDMTTLCEDCHRDLVRQR